MMNRIGSELIATAKAVAVSSQKDSERTQNKSRDLLSLLVKANMNADGLRLSDEAVIARMSILFLSVYLY
jgi:hypothetical protein